MPTFAGVALALAWTLAGAAGAAQPAVTIEGELKRWHKITLEVAGPGSSEDAAPNPFLDVRFDVVFTHTATGTKHLVPGYFAADGDAANTSATAGNVWRAHLAPDHTGEWTYKTHMVEGPRAAVTSIGRRSKIYDGIVGSFEIARSDKTGRDHRARGRLAYAERHHLRYAATGEYFIKVGSDSPENLLAYDDFDNTPNTTWTERWGTMGGYRRSYAPHVKDWREGDPAWQDGKGKGLIGALNYLASKGLNVQSFLTYSYNGDDRNVFPYVDPEDRTRMDVSKLAQWEVVFEHMDRLGMMLHFKLMEAENDRDMDGGEKLGPERQLYFRELVARFAHHLAITWNIGEENTNSIELRRKSSQYLYDLDPYKSLIVIHNALDWERTFVPLFETVSRFRGAALQRDFYDVFESTRFLVSRSAAVGRPWVVGIDESRSRNAATTGPDGVPPDAVDPDHDEPRRGSLWANLMAGGAGMETYFGWPIPLATMLSGVGAGDEPVDGVELLPVSDLTLDDFRTYDRWWDQMRAAHAFFTTNDIPFHDMRNRNELVSNGWCLEGRGTLVIYLPTGTDLIIGDTSLGSLWPLVVELDEFSGAYDVHWYDPRNGGELQTGSVAQVRGGEAGVRLGTPPRDAHRDWVVLLRPRK